MSLESAIQQGVVSGDGAMVYDPESGKHIPLKQAIRKGIVDKDSGQYLDEVSGRKISLGEAARRGLLAVVGAPVLAGGAILEAVQRVTGTTEMISTTIRDSGAINGDNIKPAIMPLEPLDALDSKPVVNGRSEPLSQLQLGRPTETGQEITIETPEFSQPRVHQQVTATTTKTKEFPTVTIDVTKSDQDQAQKPTIAKPTRPQTSTDQKKTETVKMQAGLEIIDWTTGTVTDPTTGKQITLQEAVRLNLVDPIQLKQWLS
ncbi:unnamed protein product [Owenia fusiformis]|uniref:Uncharacterized protein n=1 Tax=Owenia fusiformis TaxID=6347 RepID=A0A8J1U7Z8_OWEFU|nr:unnamed protein product [Owenia fusiformis]